MECSLTSSSGTLQYLFNTWLLFCCACQRTPSTARGWLMWTWHSSSNCERGSASLRRSFSTMWMSTCPQHTFASVTSKDVSWTGDHWSLCVSAFYICSLPLAAPIGSISSMEVNVDLLDQMELIDISDQDSLDVFFSSSGEEGGLMSPLPGMKLGTMRWQPGRILYTTPHCPTPPNHVFHLSHSPGTQ